MNSKGKSLIFLVNRLRERLWFRPATFGLASLVGVFAAGWIDGSGIIEFLPDIGRDTVVTLLSILAASMLVIATFAVGSMVSAYASAASSGTPRTLTLVLRDDVSQTAHSTFVGAFIFSVVARVALEEGYFEGTGYFMIFVEAMAVFAMVIVVFVYWVDSVARLGLLGPVIDRAETATSVVLKNWRDTPHLGGVPVSPNFHADQTLRACRVGYLQEINVKDLQAWAVEHDARVRIVALPGDFMASGTQLAWLSFGQKGLPKQWETDLLSFFSIDQDRVFDQDPRYGFVVLSEIAKRALSPAVNDPGTAIKVVGTMVRLLDLWCQPPDPESKETPVCDRVEVPDMSVDGLLNDAFQGIGRDAAGIVEAAVALQRCLKILANCGNVEVASAARYQSRVALARSEKAMALREDLMAVQSAAGGVHQASEKT